MQYLCLGYLDIEAFDRAPEEAKSKVMEACYAQCVPFRATGKVLAEEGLQHTSRAKCIRTRQGKRKVTDGPFIETKEQLGSYFIIEADSIDEAVEIAALHPGAIFGEEYGFGIEVRPIRS